MNHCVKCGAADGGTFPVWRYVTICVPLCPTCGMELVRLLNSNAEAVKFMIDLQARARLAACNVGGSA
jgi:hypothetical protein